MEGGGCKDGKRAEICRITIKNNDEIVFDSCEATDADSLDYPVDLELKPRSRYEWTVSMTADSGERAEASSYFETGKLGEDWIGKWITPGSGIVDADSMAGYILEKTFTLDKTGDARLYLCELGVYECYINGKKVGEEFLAPGYHSYDFHVQTNTYDVTEYLVSEEN